MAYCEHRRTRQESAVSMVKVAMGFVSKETGVIVAGPWVREYQGLLCQLLINSGDNVTLCYHPKKTASSCPIAQQSN